MAVTLKDSNFEEEVYGSDIPVLVDFYANWCGPCKAMAPVVDALEKEYDGRIKVGKLNVDANQKTAAQYGVRSIPTFILLKGKDIKGQKVGMQDKKTLAALIDAVL